MKKDRIAQKTNISWSRLATILILTTITAFVVSSSTWFFVNLGENNIAKTNQSTTSMLESQILQLKVALKTQQTLVKNSVAIGSSSTARQ